MGHDGGMWTENEACAVALVCGMLLGARVTKKNKRSRARVAEFTVRATPTGISFDCKRRNVSHELLVPNCGGFSGAFKYIFHRLGIILLNSHEFIPSRPYYPLKAQLCVLPPLEGPDFCAILLSITGAALATTSQKRFYMTFTMPRRTWQDQPHTLTFSFQGRTAIVGCKHCLKKANRPIAGPVVDRNARGLCITRPDALLGYFYVFSRLHDGELLDY